MLITSAKKFFKMYALINQIRLVRRKLEERKVKMHYHFLPFSRRKKKNGGRGILLQGLPYLIPQKNMGKTVN
jgi:hypothetical protein